MLRKLGRYLNQLHQDNDIQFQGFNHTFYFDNSRGQFKNHNIKITTYLGLSDIKSSLTTNHTDIEIVPDRIKSNFDNIKKAHGQRGLSEK